MSFVILFIKASKSELIVSLLIVSQSNILWVVRGKAILKNLTGDVLIVPLERKIATEIVDLHAAAFLELPLEKLDGQRVLDPLLDHTL